MSDSQYYVRELKIFSTRDWDKSVKTEDNTFPESRRQHLPILQQVKEVWAGLEPDGSSES